MWLTLCYYYAIISTAVFWCCPFHDSQTLCHAKIPFPTTLTRSPLDIGGFNHVERVWPNRAPTKEGPHRPENVGQQHNIFWPVRALSWRFATYKRSLGAERHSLCAVLQGLNFTTLLTYLFPKQKIYVRATIFLLNSIYFGLNLATLGSSKVNLWELLEHKPCFI